VVLLLTPYVGYGFELVTDGLVVVLLLTPYVGYGFELVTDGLVVVLLLLPPYVGYVGYAVELNTEEEEEEGGP